MPEPSNHTPRRTIRMSDETWAALEVLRESEGFRSRAAWLEVMVRRERDKRQKRQRGGDK